MPRGLWPRLLWLPFFREKPGHATAYVPVRILCLLQPWYRVLYQMPFVAIVMHPFIR